MHMEHRRQLGHKTKHLLGRAEGPEAQQGACSIPQHWISPKSVQLSISEIMFSSFQSCYLM